MSSIDYRNYGKPLARAAILFFIMEINRMFSGPLSKIGLNLVMWATFSGILFFPRSWWTRSRLWMAAGIVLIESALGVIWFQEWKLSYLIAIFTFGAAMHLFLSKSPVPAMVAMFITAILYNRFGSENLFNFLSFALMAVVLYFSIRSRMQRNELHELNKRHLTELQEAYEQLQEASATAMRYAVLEERTRIARDIHDAVGHSLTSLIVQMQALKFMIRKDPAQAEQSLEGMLAVAREGLHDIRTSVHSLAGNRSISGLTSLKALLNRMEASASIRYTFHADFHDDDVSAGIYETLFKILQEAITNVIRHSRATQLEVGLKREQGKTTMQIRDNGIFAPSQEIREGFGLKAMKARLEERGGSLRCSAAEPHGLELIAEIPEAEQARGHDSGKDG